jgi:hypothetical protein
MAAAEGAMPSQHHRGDARRKSEGHRCDAIVRSLYADDEMICRETRTCGSSAAYVSASMMVGEDQARDQGARAEQQNRYGEEE